MLDFEATVSQRELLSDKVCWEEKKRIFIHYPCGLRRGRVCLTGRLRSSL